MPMVIKLTHVIRGTLWGQFCFVFQLTGDIVEKLLRADGRDWLH